MSEPEPKAIPWRLKFPIAGRADAISTAIRALLIVNEYLNAEVERPRASQSVGYVRGRTLKR